MNDFLLFYDSIKDKYHWSLDIYHSSVVDWNITIGYGPLHKKHGATIINVQDCDMELAFAMAQVKLKEYLKENHNGY